MAIRLSELQAGERGRVTELRLPPEQAGTLLRLGLLPGAEILCLRRCPLGDPTVYRFRGTDLALRRRETALIRIEPGVCE